MEMDVVRDFFINFLCNRSSICTRDVVKAMRRDK